MTKAEPALGRASVCRKSRIRARHQRLLQFRRHPQIGFHLLVLLANLAVALFEFANVRKQKRVLYLEKRFGTDESKESAVFVHQQDVVVKIFVRACEHGAQDISNRRRNFNARFLLAKMAGDRLARPKRKTVASAK